MKKIILLLLTLVACAAVSMAAADDLKKPDSFEFHLSNTDLDLDIGKYLKGTYDCDFVVHAPELFAGSKLMDLATPDDEYREYSILETH